MLCYRLSPRTSEDIQIYRNRKQVFISMIIITKNNEKQFLKMAIYIQVSFEIECN